MAVAGAYVYGTYNVGTLNGSVEIADHLRENDVATEFDSQGKPFVAFDEAADRSLVIRRRGSRGRGDRERACGSDIQNRRSHQSEW